MNTGNPEYEQRWWEAMRVVDKLASDFPKEYAKKPISYQTNAEYESKTS